MSNCTAQRRSTVVRLPWRVACLVLTVFLLYNPFFTICPAAGPDATLQHHVSYRSTVAASELGCSDLQHSEVSLEPNVAIFVAFSDAVRPVEVRATRPSGETVAASDGFASSLWSRPPPTL